MDLDVVGAKSYADHTSPDEVRRNLSELTRVHSGDARD